MWGLMFFVRLLEFPYRDRISVMLLISDRYTLRSFTSLNIFLVSTIKMILLKITLHFNTLKYISGSWLPKHYQM